MSRGVVFLSPVFGGLEETRRQIFELLARLGYSVCWAEALPWSENRLRIYIFLAQIGDQNELARANPLSPDRAGQEGDEYRDEQIPSKLLEHADAARLTMSKPGYLK
jgi:hypothetical protein